MLRLAVPSNRKFLARAIKRYLPRCNITEAENGKVAIDLVAANPSKYHVCLLDKEMPVSTLGERVLCGKTQHVCVACI